MTGQEVPLCADRRWPNGIDPSQFMWFWLDLASGEGKCFQRSPKEDELRSAEYRDLDEVRESILR